MARSTGADRAAPLEVQRAAWAGLGIDPGRIELEALERELADLRLWRQARDGERGALEEIADRENAYDTLLSLARDLNAAVREDPDLDGYLLATDGSEHTSEEPIA